MSGTVSLSNENLQAVQKICPDLETLCSVQRNIPCTICGKSMPNTAAYDFHMRKTHRVMQGPASSVGPPKQFYCPVKNCLYSINSNRFFAKLKYLKQHFLKVHAEKNVSCTTCTKTFATEALLKAHALSCGKNFPCGACQATYSSYEALLTHIRRQNHFVHANVKLNHSTSTPQVSVENNSGHFMAAVALSEFSAAAYHKPVVDVGIQTDLIPSGRAHKGTSPAQSSATSKRKRSAETQTAAKKSTAETQTGVKQPYAETSTATKQDALPINLPEPTADMFRTLDLDLWLGMAQNEPKGTQTSPRLTTPSFLDDIFSEAETQTDLLFPDSDSELFEALCCADIQTQTYFDEPIPTVDMQTQTQMNAMPPLW